MEHLILTRFNLPIWKKDKRGESTHSDEWLHERCKMFEDCCMPSVMAQTCKDFRWIILFSANSPEWLKEKIRHWKTLCPQMRPISANLKRKTDIIKIYREVAGLEASQEGGRMLMTYLDNDDALHREFVEDIQRRAAAVGSGSFLCYHYGLQYYTDMEFATRVPYLYNHFPTYVADYKSPDGVDSFFIPISHAQMKRYPKDKVVHFDNRRSPMWVEVVHHSNRYNDVRMTLRTCPVTDSEVLQRDFGMTEILLAPHPWRIFFTRFVPRFIRIFFRQAGYKIFGIEWK